VLEAADSILGRYVANCPWLFCTLPLVMVMYLCGVVISCFMRCFRVGFFLWVTAGILEESASVAAYRSTCYVSTDRSSSLVGAFVWAFVCSAFIDSHCLFMGVRGRVRVYVLIFMLQRII